jgi:hypothetical protein
LISFQLYFSKARISGHFRVLFPIFQLPARARVCHQQPVRSNSHFRQLPRSVSDFSRPLRGLQTRFSASKASVESRPPISSDFPQLGASFGVIFPPASQASFDFLTAGLQYFRRISIRCLV